MTSNTYENTFSLKESAEFLDISISRLGRLLEEQALATVKIDGEQRIPKSFFHDGAVIAGLRGTLILLADLGLEKQDAIEWLHEYNEELSATPVEALQKGHKAPVRRAAQLLA